MPRRKQLNPQPVKLDSEDEGVAAADPESFVLESDFLLERHLQFDENETEPHILGPERGVRDAAELIGWEEFPLCFSPLSMEADPTHSPESEPEEGGACAHCGQSLSLAGPYCPRCGGRSGPAPPAEDDDDEESLRGGEEGGDGPPKLHSCMLCHFSSRYSNHLKRHMKTHNGEKPYRCPLCAYASAQLVNLQRHLRIHTGEKPYSCAHCDFACSSLGNLKRHQRMHTVEQRMHTPEQRSNSSVPGNRHAAALPEGEGLAESAGGAQQAVLLAHRHGNHLNRGGDLPREPDGAGGMAGGGVGGVAGGRGVVGGEVGGVTGGRGVAMGEVGGVTGGGVKGEDGGRAGGVPGGRGVDGGGAGGGASALPELLFPFTCRLCGVVLEDEDGSSAQICAGCTLDLLSKPPPERAGERFFSCALCSFSTQYPNHLARHMKTHSGEKPYKCPQCSYASAHFDNLKRHHRVHTGEKPYKCHLCDYACGNLANLKRHQRIHSGAKPFQCGVCSYSCNQSMNLKRHMLRHTGEKPFGCPLCPYTTGHWDNYKRHQRKHGHAPHAWAREPPPPGEGEEEGEEEDDEEEEEEEDV